MNQQQQRISSGRIINKISSQKIINTGCRILFINNEGSPGTKAIDAPNISGLFFAILTI